MSIGSWQTSDYTLGNNITFTLDNSIYYEGAYWNFKKAIYLMAIYNEDGTTSAANGGGPITPTYENNKLLFPVASQYTQSYKVWIRTIITLENSSGETTFTAEVTFNRYGYIFTPSLIAPTSTLIDISSPINFAWQIKHGTQVKYKIQYKQSDVWNDLVPETISNAKEYNLSAYALTSSGRYEVRIGCQGSDNKWKYSDSVQFIGSGKPPTPAFESVENKARPIIAWVSAGQSAYKLDIYKAGNLLLSTGFIYGEEKSYKFSEYLSNGIYEAILTIKGSDGLISNAASKVFAINVTSPAKPIVTAQQVDNGVVFTVYNLSNKMQLISNGKIISEFTDYIVYDYTSVGTNDYIIRAIDSNDNFADSDTITATTVINSVTIALADTPYNLIPLKLFSKDGAKSGQTEYTCKETQFAGRTYPTFEFGESKSKSINLKYSLFNKSDFSKLIDFISQNKTLLYRDYDGDKEIGIIKSIDYTVSAHVYKIDCELLITETI